MTANPADAQMTEFLTASELAALLKISKSKVYELTNKRTRSGELRPNPLPVVRLGDLVRFNKVAVDNWLQTLATKKSEQ